MMRNGRCMCACTFMFECTNMCMHVDVHYFISFSFKYRFVVLAFSGISHSLAVICNSGFSDTAIRHGLI